VAARRLLGPGLDFTEQGGRTRLLPAARASSRSHWWIHSSRLGLADARGLQVTAFDLKPRVEQHLTRSRTRAEAGEGYLVHVPIARADRWRPEFLAFWKGFGDSDRRAGSGGAIAGDGWRRIGQGRTSSGPPWCSRSRRRT
jgi:hypothetical protein